MKKEEALKIIRSGTSCEYPARNRVGKKIYLFGEGKTQEGLIVHSEGDWLKIVVTDEYNKLDAGFGYTLPGANTKVVFTFTVNGLAN